MDYDKIKELIPSFDGEKFCNKHCRCNCDVEETICYHMQKVLRKIGVPEKQARDISRLSEETEEFDPYGFSDFEYEDRDIQDDNW